MKKCLANLILRAQEAGCSVDQDAIESGTIALDAPKGRVFEANGGSSYTIPAAVSGQSWWAEACRDAIAVLDDGVREPVDEGEWDDVKDAYVKVDAELNTTEDGEVMAMYTDWLRRQG